MRARAILKRLIWKETRESLLTASVGFVAPAIILLTIRTKLKPPEWTFAILLLIAVLGTFLWAAGKANAKRGSNDFEDACLVLPESVDWLASYLFPALISFAIGAWLGYVLSCLPHWSEAHWSHTQSWTVLSCGLYVMAGFVVSYAASSAFGFLGGAIIGTVWLIFPGVPLVTNQTNKVVDESAVLVALMVRTVVGAAAGSFLVALASRARPQPKLRAIPLIVAVLSCFGPLIPDPAKLFPGPESRYLNYAIVSKSSSDGSLVVGPTGKNAGMSASLKLVSLRTGATWVRSFHQAVQPVALTDRVAFLAQQGIGKDSVRVLAWDAATGKVKCVAEIRAGRNAIWNCRPGAVSPDGRLLVFGAGAPVGPGHDFWVLNTRSGRHSLLIPGMTSECPPIQWTGDHALLPFGGKIICIRLADLTRREIDIPIPSEVQQ